MLLTMDCLLWASLQWLNSLNVNYPVASHITLMHASEFWLYPDHKRMQEDLLLTPNLAQTWSTSNHLNHNIIINMIIITIVSDISLEYRKRARRMVKGRRTARLQSTAAGGPAVAKPGGRRRRRQRPQQPGRKALRQHSPLARVYAPSSLLNCLHPNLNLWTW